MRAPCITRNGNSRCQPAGSSASMMSSGRSPWPRASRSARRISVSSISCIALSVAGFGHVRTHAAITDLLGEGGVAEAHVVARFEEVARLEPAPLQHVVEHQAGGAPV